MASLNPIHKIYFVYYYNWFIDQTDQTVDNSGSVFLSLMDCGNKLLRTNNENYIMVYTRSTCGSVRNKNHLEA